MSFEAVKKLKKSNEPATLERSSSFHSNLATSFIDQEGVDCTFELHDAEKPLVFKQIGAHKIVLAAASPVFKTMFFGSFNDKMPIRINDIPFQAFKWLLW